MKRKKIVGAFVAVVCWLVLIAVWMIYTEGGNKLASREVKVNESTEQTTESSLGQQNEELDILAIENDDNMAAETEKVEKIEKTEKTEKTEKERIAELKNALPKSADILVSAILQEPELPTGCESVALTMVLNSFGYQLEKTTIADDYLIYSEDNFAEGYLGNPYSYSGAGIFPPGLVNTANRFLKEQKDEKRAYNISGEKFEDLYAYVAAGYPVLIWITMYNMEPVFTGDYIKYQGQTYEWYGNEHCVVLSGYDLTKNTVTIQDPLQGETVQERDIIEEFFETTGKYAMAIY